jgi:8-oxo-dGTP diphosphatase
MIACEFENGNKASLRHVCTDAIVIKDGQIVLVKRASELQEGGKWALPGGFMERDETITQTVAREVQEETGWTVHSLRLFAVNTGPSQRGTDRQNVVFIYLCEAGSKTGESDRESDEIKWYDLDGLPSADDMAFDHLEVIELYRRNLTDPQTLPIVR